MNKKLFSGLSIILLSILFISTGVSHSEGDTHEEHGLIGPNVTEVENSRSIDLQELKEVFNSSTVQIPGFAASLIGDQTVAVEMGEEVDFENNSIGFKMEDVKITEIKWGSYNDTTLEINVTRDNLNTILSAKSPVNKAGTMLETGELEYEALNFGNKVRMGLFRLFTGF